jgi:CHRD domain
MKTYRVMVLTLIALLALASAAAAQVGGSVTTRLRAFEEVPALSTPGGGNFNATIAPDGSHMTYEMNYLNLEGNVTQSHIHIAQPGVNGGIMVFLCSNLGNGPAGTQACPSSPGIISGTIDGTNVIGPNGQGVGAGEMFSLVRAIRAGFAYANLHTDVFPGGEIRGQLRFTPSPIIQ